MSDADCEIEYLDEDADIVQQCVQPHNISNLKHLKQVARSTEDRSLLVERELERKRKRKRNDDDDSDYDPREDLHAIEVKKNKKKPLNIPTKKQTRPKPLTSLPVNTFITSTGKRAIAINDINARKKLDIRIPDYDDPLCLPVRAIVNSKNDLQRVRNWNNMCLEHFKTASTVLRPEKGAVKSSARSVVLRNVVHKETGKQETAVWSKICIENEDGVKKSEIFQSILPKYREKKMLKSFHISKHSSKFRHINETILTKEDHKDGNVLVVYKPREKVSAVYKFLTDPNKVTAEGEDEPKKSLKEIVVCKVCAPCYQTSWRGAKKNEDKALKCPICGRGSVSVYNLLTHVRAHNAPDVRRRAKEIAAALAKVVDYHYRCRVCDERFFSIKALRQHVATHKGNETFRCEVGNHTAK
ncbi:uncharacterized protein LOC114358253 [Ostrinia furnacalis]|uniref:uncharacterized protein LOC114358253 n=1 Tax=Ostrinia furnacalis TaxID=93504 RepID=UPI00103A8B68|nr:uncharacterized protein LOC114358253 [Ostrinia furnacalis]